MLTVVTMMPSREIFYQIRAAVKLESLVVEDGESRKLDLTWKVGFGRNNKLLVILIVYLFWKRTSWDIAC